MKVSIMISMAFLLGSLSSVTTAAESDSQCKDYDVFVMRHLEKMNNQEKDPGLSHKGQESAKKLSGLPVLSKVSHGFYTPYKRTFETLQFLDIPKSVYDPSQNQALINAIKSEFCGKSVLVVGHSNTVPSIIQALGGKFEVSFAGKRLDKMPSVFLSEADYGSVFRITLHNERLHQQLYHVNQASAVKVNDE